MKRYSALFFLGILLGMLIMHSFQGRELEKLYWEKENLKVELYENREQMKKMQELHKTLLPSVVREIKLEINIDDNNFVEPALRHEIYDLVKGILGQEVQALPYPLALNILDNRIVELDKKRYNLDVEAIILGETMVYYLKAQKLAEEELP
ncbi:MAG: hypothetical protein Q7J85_15445 [Bacillota bacterium]|nr:hypothetical protein [Bacillota bacterium]